MICRYGCSEWSRANAGSTLSCKRKDDSGSHGQLQTSQDLYDGWLNSNKQLNRTTKQTLITQTSSHPSCPLYSKGKANSLSRRLSIQKGLELHCAVDMHTHVTSLVIFNLLPLPRQTPLWSWKESINYLTHVFFQCLYIPLKIHASSFTSCSTFVHENGYFHRFPLLFITCLP